MRRIKTSTGIDVPLDGDLLALMEILYREVTAKRDLDRSFDEMQQEIANLVSQMSLGELRRYLQEALFVNTVTYENQRTAAYIRRVGGRPSGAATPGTRTRGRSSIANGRTGVKGK